MNKFVTFSLLLLIAFLIARHNNGGKNPLITPKSEKEASLEGNSKVIYDKEEAMPELEGSFSERMLSRVFINALKTERGRLLIEKVFQPMNVPASDPDFSMKMNDRMYLDSALHIKVANEGNSSFKAICGHKVEIDYKIVNMGNIVLESGVKQITLGRGDIFKSVDNIVIGMREGEVRKALVPSKMAYEDPGYKGKKPLNKTSDYKIKIKLNKINSEMSIEPHTKIFDSEVSFRFPILCGDRIHTQAKIAKLDGKVMYDSRKYSDFLKFRLGEQSYPVIFSHGLFNKQDKGVRTLIFKGKYLESFDGTNSLPHLNLKAFNPKEYYILEFMNSQIEK